MALSIIALDPLSNKVLAELPGADFGLLAPHFVCEPLAQEIVLAETGDEVEQVYFPLSGMISLVIVMKDGKAIETATIGHEGTYGTAVAFGAYKSRVRAIIQIGMNAARLSAVQFRKAAATSVVIHRLGITENERMLTHARITAACNALHKVESRFARWLLQSSAMIESDTVALTQEFLSEMLGVRRTSVTEVATRMQADGVISYSRGRIRILDRPALEALCCECFRTLREQNAF
jgi:CRP-like cAMP-binding protein